MPGGLRGKSGDTSQGLAPHPSARPACPATLQVTREARGLGTGQGQPGSPEVRGKMNISLGKSGRLSMLPLPNDRPVVLGTRWKLALLKVPNSVAGWGQSFWQWMGLMRLGCEKPSAS